MPTRIENRYQAIVESAPDAILLADSDGRITLTNDRVTELFGYDSDELIGEPIEVLVPEAKRDDHVEQRNAYLADPETRPMGADLDLWAQHKDGTAIPVDIRLSPIEGDGELEVMAAIRDRTEQETLRRTYRTILSAVPDAVVVADTTSGEIVETNEQVTDLLGYEPEELIGEPQTILHPTGEASRYRDLFERHIAAGQTTFTQLPDGSDIEVETKSGERIPVEINAQVFELQDDRLIVGVFRDITSRRAYERELERAETAIQASGDAVYMLDPDGRFTFVNDALTETSGYDENQFLGAHVSLVMDDEDITRGENLIQELLTSDRDRGTFEMTVYAADGREIPTQNHVAIITTDDGRLHRSVGVVRDITELKAREAALQRENERLDEFASVVSHDLRNPLTVALGSLELLRDDCESDQLETIERSLTRMDQLIDDVLTLAREGETVSDIESVDLRSLVSGCWNTVETHAADLTIKTEGSIRGDPSRLKQLFENLFRNAIEHGGDDVTITVGELDDGFFVADDGPGIPPNKREAVIEAGYSQTEQGTGLGLSIVNRIVEAHGWDLAIRESETGGTRFEFRGVEIAD